MVIHKASEYHCGPCPLPEQPACLLFGFRIYRACTLCVHPEVSECRRALKPAGGGFKVQGREGARAESWRCLLSMPSHLRCGLAGPHRENWRRKTRPDHHEPWKPLGTIWVWTWAYGLWRHQSTRGTGSQTCFSERSFWKLRKGLTGMSRAQNRQT